MAASSAEIGAVVETVDRRYVMDLFHHASKGEMDWLATFVAAAD